MENINNINKEKPLSKVVEDEKNKFTEPVTFKDWEKKKLNEISHEEFEDIRADLIMLNQKIRENMGIINLNESDFKSQYGKNRFLKLKHIRSGIPVTFNRDELQTIGGEMDNLLSEAKIIKKREITEDDIRKKAYELYEKRIAEKEEGDQAGDWYKAESQLKKENEENKSEKIPDSFDELSNKITSEKESEILNEKNMIPNEKENTKKEESNSILNATVSSTELNQVEKKKMETPESDGNPVKLDEKKEEAKVDTEEKKSAVPTPEAGKIDSAEELLKPGVVFFDGEYEWEIMGLKGWFDHKFLIKKNIKEENRQEEVVIFKRSLEKALKNEKIKIISEAVSEVPKIEKEYTIKDLLKKGTEFEDTLFEYKVTNVGRFNDIVSLGIVYKSNSQKDVFYDSKRDLKERFRKGEIKITKVLK